jgi:hypothetical protein
MQGSTRSTTRELGAHKVFFVACSTIIWKEEE